MKNFRERGTLQYVEQKFQAMDFGHTAYSRKANATTLFPSHITGAMLTWEQLSVHSIAASY